MNVRHFHEKLKEVEGIGLSLKLVKQRCKARVWWRESVGAVRTAEEVRGARCRE